METNTLEINGVKIHCSFNEMVDTEKLQPHPVNWNKHPPKQIDIFKKILEYNGIRRPVKVSKRSGFVTAGHGLLLAAQEMKLPKVPVDYQEYETEEAELADLTADNQLARLAETNVNVLTELYTKLDTGLFDLEFTGTPLTQIEKLMTTVAPVPEISFSEGHAMDNSVTPGVPDAVQPVEGPMPSHVRMVQLFFDENTIVVFNELCTWAKEYFGKDNITDSVLEAMRYVRSNPPERPVAQGQVGQSNGAEAHQQVC